MITEVTTTYRETGTLIEKIGNICRVQIGCEIRFIHATKVFCNGKCLAE